MERKNWSLLKNRAIKDFRHAWNGNLFSILNQQYAEEIALKWNTEDEFSGYAGHVTAFDLPQDFIAKYPVQNVGGEIHNELWVPAAELEEFNNNIIGEIRVVKSFLGKKYKQ